MYEYAAVIRSVTDADTIRVDLDLGLWTWVHNLALRLYGIDAPEVTTPEGKTARAWLRERLPVGHPVIVQTIKDTDDKYGRLLAVVFDPSTEMPLAINQQLLDAGMARPYYGVGQKPWTAA